MSEQMEFPETFEGFAKEYGFKDKKEIYTNGDDLIPIFRVKQWIEHDNKLRKIETDTAYECGKHANRWISVSERLPKADEYVGNIAKYYLVQNEFGDMMVARYTHSEYWVQMYQLKPIANKIIAWCELPQPFKAESEEEE
jgi:hypothetical protein